MSRPDSTLRVSPLLPARGFLDDTEVPVKVRTHGQTDLDFHRHEFTELVIVLEGTGDHLLDDRRFPICAGDAFVIDENHSHGYHATRDLRIVNVLFDEPFVLQREPSLASMPGYHAFLHLEPRSRRRIGFEGKLRLGAHSMTEVHRLVDRLVDELDSRRDGYAAMTTGMLVELLVILCRLYTESDIDAHRDLMDIGRVIGFLEHHYSRDIELADLLGLVAMSERSLLRKFSRATGTTPTQYLIRVRLAHGARLLRTTSSPVTEISGLVGFDDANYFSRQFRQAYSASPTQYRRSVSA